MFIHVLSKFRFDTKMEQEGWNDKNIPSDKAFISICCTPDIKKNYIEDYKHKSDEHWFKENHPNVLNLNFDDIQEDKKETAWGIAYGMTDEDANKIVEFVKQNADKEDLYLHCMAGKSRSVAVGWALREHFGCQFSCMYGLNSINDFVYKKLKEKL